jgi:hypothetical protein
VASIDKATFRRMMTDSPETLHEFAIADDAEVRLLNDDVAVVAHKVREEMTVEGKPVSLEAADASTWVRRGDRWVCAAHAEAITGDPFGRDRKPPRPSRR